MAESFVIESSPKLEHLFLHFFDTHFIADKGTAAESESFKREMRLATRMAVASAETVYIPAASYYESPLCRQILGELEELVTYGLIVLSGGAINLEEYLRERQDESFYRRGSRQHEWYRAAHSSLHTPPYLRRVRSATRDITAHWKQRVTDDSLARMLRDALEEPLKGLEQRLERVPQELGRLAFIPDHAYEILNLQDAPPLLRARIRSVINEGYFESYVKDLSAGVMVDLKYLASDFEMPSYGQNLSYTKLLRFLQEHGRLNELATCAPLHLVRMGSEPPWQQAARTAVSYIGAVAPAYLAESSRQTRTSLTMTTFSSNPQSPMAFVPQTTVLCVAAAQVEFEAVRLRLTREYGNEQLVHLDEKHTLYALRYDDSAGGVSWYLAGLSFQGEVEAATAVSHMYHQLKPTIALMVGMCMGMPERQLPVGTVVVPNEVAGYDHRRATASGEQFRQHGGWVDDGLYQVARILSGRERNYRVIADKGLASSSVKIEHVNIELVTHIQTAFPDAAAFDMEGFGFYRALKDTRCLWIKGIADSGEPQHGATDGRDQKQRGQSGATENAIDFAIEVVRYSCTSQAAH